MLEEGGGTCLTMMDDPRNLTMGPFAFENRHGTKRRGPLNTQEFCYAFDFGDFFLFITFLYLSTKFSGERSWFL